MSAIPTSVISAGSLLGGYLTGRATGVRPAGGVVLLAGAVACGRRWRRTVGPARTAALLATYVGAFGASHPLAKRIGAWPSVAVATGAVGAAAYVLADRSARG
ncbi:hypothetical protein [Motilibacter aurantiacus]|uniref:hypothetical protein n=1 Tax=Motilibacter aurantiacus TaxID=2714955 RepID=UPI0014092B3A|nr:hypothetical protein [Motilibacter aurantiacus]NHC45342.1 hypothetical protein [Motilibacter aurantiacus]